MPFKSKIPEGTMQVLSEARKFTKPEEDVSESTRTFINPLGQMPEPTSAQDNMPKVSLPFAINYRIILAAVVVILLAVNGILLLIPYLENLVGSGVSSNSVEDIGVHSESGSRDELLEIIGKP